MTPGSPPVVKCFALLNQHRNRILKALPVPLIFVGEPGCNKSFAKPPRISGPSAPRWCACCRTVNQRSPRLEGASLQTQQAATGVEAAERPGLHASTGHRLANRRDLAFQRAELLIRAAAGFRENARLELAESCWREALNALTDASETKQQTRSDDMRATVLNNLAVVLSDLGLSRGGAGQSAGGGAHL